MKTFLSILMSAVCLCAAGQEKKDYTFVNYTFHISDNLNNPLKALALSNIVYTMQTDGKLLFSKCIVA